MIQSLPRPDHLSGARGTPHTIANVKAALAAAGLAEGFLNAVGPASCVRFANDYYESDEELLYAAADAMREEYTAIIDAGLILQIDDPSIAESWDQVNPEPSVEAYQRYPRVRAEALNHALRGWTPCATRCGRRSGSASRTSSTRARPGRCCATGCATPTRRCPPPPGRPSFGTRP